MSNPQSGSKGPAHVDRAEIYSALFAQMILQQSNLAMMLLGKMPHPQTGKAVQDIEGAKMFIDQLEMLEVKTKGNLSPDEEALLKHSLMSLRLAFVEAVESPAPAEPAAASEPAGRTGEAPAAASERKPEEAGDSDADSKKKFSKRY
jgi:hypothetical protein